MSPFSSEDTDQKLSFHPDGDICVLSKTADNIKVSGAVDITEGTWLQPSST